jgi:hypothetical protein
MMKAKPLYSLLIIVALTITACGTLATPVWQPAAAHLSPAQPTSIPLNVTPSPMQTATPLLPGASPSPLPATAIPQEPEPESGGPFTGDAVNGEILFNTFQPDAGFACATCHRADSEDRLIGPGLLNIGKRAADRVEGQGALEYIRTSIINPGAYVVETFPDGLMPQNWAEIYAKVEINDIIAYLLTLG